jgi:hypothetical protein
MPDLSGPDRTEGRESRGFSEPNGLDRRVGLGVRVSKVEGNVQLERPSTGRVFHGALLGFGGFGSERKWRVVRVSG